MDRTAQKSNSRLWREGSLAASSQPDRVSWVRDGIRNGTRTTCPFDLINLVRGGSCSSDLYMRWRAVIMRTSASGVDESILSGGVSLRGELDGVLLLLVGDSLCREQWVELACALHGAEHTRVRLLDGYNYTPRDEKKESGHLLARVHSPGVANTWVGFLQIDSMQQKSHAVAAEARQLTENVARLQAELHSAKQSAVRGLTVALHLCSIKAHTLKSRGYETPDGYFDDLANFANELQHNTNASFLYYRPGPTTHFATADAGYVPTTGMPEPCRPITQVASQKAWFVREEEAMGAKLDAHFSGKVTVLRGVWALSQDAWTQHPSMSVVHHPDTHKPRNISDCLHYCIAGDGAVGVYDAFNRLWWWHMQADLSQRSPTKRASLSGGGGRSGQHPSEGFTDSSTSLT